MPIIVLNQSLNEPLTQGTRPGMSIALAIIESAMQADVARARSMERPNRRL